MTEPRREFERSLESIEAKVIELFAMMAEDLPKATEALLSGSPEILAQLAERESAIDALYPQIEELAAREILLQAPVASDLRYLLTVLRVVPEIERSHDLIMSIASRAGHLVAQDLPGRVQGLVRLMGDRATSMWRRATDAWYQRDREAAGRLVRSDEEIDDLYSSLVAELASGGVRIPVAMEMTLAAHSYERLAAHAVNICRRVTYLAGTGPSTP
ncbi:MAG: phosphate uptake regulator PhoU [Streptosporangiales bacterium]|nr:phosphate uptake regulator PhoU [Streptosporangiales bacterium]